ncbi:hypothetical protein GGF46_005229 [Coemansia sp. RSA 552]|nr:hypothetical protein GGF46_005229 [Coemansia sp. RSA 552]
MVFCSIAPSVDIPALDVVSFCLGASQMNAKEEAIAYHDLSTEESITFGELRKRVDQVGSGLVNRLGIRRGEVVAVFSSNSVNYAPVFFGTIAAGAVCCTVSSAFREAELDYQLGDCQARALFVGPAQVPVVQRALQRGMLGGIGSRIIVLGDTSKFIPLASLLSVAPYEQRRIGDVEDARRTLAAIVYSSGTTGLPKGVMLSHWNLVACTMLSANMFEYLAHKGQQELAAQDPNTGGDGSLNAQGLKTEENGDPEAQQRSIAILPFAHIYGLTSLVTNSVAGGKSQYIMSGQFSVNAFLGAVQKYRIGIVSAVPSIISQISKHPHLDRFDLSSLRVLGSGAAALPSGIHHRIRGQIPKSSTTVNGYGMSETCSGVCAMTSYRLIPGSVGFLYPNTEAKIVDPTTGRELGANEQGEFCIRSPTVMMGYLNRPGETRQTIDKDGFLHTGDIAYIAETGHVFITDRMKELIKYKGLQVAPAELESTLIDHPRVRDAAVIGIHDKQRNTEVPRALVVLKDPPAGRPAQLQACQEISQWLADRVADHKRLRGGIEPIDCVPRNLSGKILRRELRTKHNAQAGAKI